MDRPADLFDRTKEWNDLAAFAQDITPGLRIAIVSGRRRQGKSYLLRRVTAGAAGMYHQAQELERTQALARFAADVAQGIGLPEGAVAFDSWETALRTALGLPGRGQNAFTAGAAGPRRFLVIDELPYLLAHSPEIPSVLQELVDESRSNTGAPSAAVVVCGSALSVMTELLSGTAPLRGRAQLDVTIRPFAFHDAARFWGLTDPEVAFRVNAVLGGTAGYRALVGNDRPGDVDDFGRWLSRGVLSPAHALFQETGYLLREDPRVTSKQVFNAILRAIADGSHTNRDIGAAVGRDANQLRHPLDALIDAGFVVREEDMLRQRRAVYTIADPIIRFSEIVIEPHRALIEEGDWAVAWEQSRDRFSTHILGPHFERLCREWTSRNASTALGIEPVGEVGFAVINDDANRAKHEVDVYALARGSRRGDDTAAVRVVGEAKATNKRRTLADLARLDRIREVLLANRVNAGAATLALFSRTGFDDNLLAASSQRPDVALVDLESLYAGTPT